MSDARGYDDQSLPWLEAVENEDGPRAISARKMLVALLLVLLAGAIVAGTMFWLGRQDPAVTGAPELIRAEPGPYKVKPTDPGGLDVAGRQRDRLFDQRGRGSRCGARRAQAAAGNGRRLPRSRRRAAPPPKKIPPNETKEPAPDDAAAPPAPSGPTIQLGAYASTIKADTAWKLLSGRFPKLRRCRKSVVTATVGGKSIYRLRASGSSDQTKRGLRRAEGGRRKLPGRQLMQAAIYGLSGTELLAEEVDFFRDAEPAGYILFKRNIESREQLRRLTDAIRDLEGHDEVPILIDQEGGRVARMRPPEWPAFPAGEAFDQLYQLAPSSAIEAARVNARALGLMLHEVGVNVDCLPMLDVRQPGATDIVGDRALGSEPMQVAALGRAILDGLASAGVLGVIKHIPGHGRALVDSHHELPIVDASEEELAIDLEPFERLRDAPMGMTSHMRLHGLGRRAAGLAVADSSSTRSSASGSASTAS